MKSPKTSDFAATPEEIELRRVSGAQWNDYVSRFRPAEAALAKSVELTAGERAQVKGEVSADTAAAFKGLSRETISATGQAGADVSSGKTKLSLAGNTQAAGRSRGVGQAIAETGAEIDETSKQLGLVALGRDIATDVTSDLSRGARRATGLALAESAAKRAKNEALLGAFSTVAGAATRKFGDPFGDKDKDPLKLSFFKKRAVSKDLSPLFLENSGVF